ncbi:MAG: hypothetical protein HC802_19075 [Caldilineaceae bacterium]|nr:hypothetical protein [Caldilineaceae bacterium]
MIISHSLKYVYIGIPRTGSKSMNRWLMDHFDGEWVGFHHGWNVPEEARDYLIFTVVRNPYERATSGWFAVPWSAESVPPPKPASQFAEEMRQHIPLKDGALKIEGHNVPEVGMNQKHFVEKSGASLLLHFERLPGCLQELPFVDPAQMPPFPHQEERAPRPAGDFFDFFSMEDEQLVWEYAAEDFEAFGYHRFECGLPQE